MVWLSRITEHSTYAGGMLGPMLVLGAGLGLLFVPIFLVALTRVRDDDAGVASACSTSASRSAARSGWRSLGTVAWSAVASSLDPRRPPRPRRRSTPRAPSAAQQAAL